MRRRLLSIASIVCLVAFVALMGMWVRSYYWSDCIGWSNKKSFVIAFTSLHGRVRFLQLNLPPGTHLGYTRIFVQLPAKGVMFDTDNDIERPGAVASSRFYWSSRASDKTVAVPFWFLVVASGSLAMLLRMRWPLRFSLRSMLIATTFLAVVLGMIAWLDRAWIGK
jgi:hypothetical protein